ncbi:DUF3459 domain-containing protein, partial [Kitasatospora sp. NPDC059973]|uniref:DUF3459 domain-containing protein n=1 Tax=Kitasatospora sp. NPDC059973 TaxID=3347020 RepID=UPI00369F53AA
LSLALPGAVYLYQGEELGLPEVEAQSADPGSMLALYRAALRLRRAEDALRGDAFGWTAAPGEVLAFHRGAGFQCVVNLGAAPHPLPAHRAVLLASGPLTAGGLLPPDTAVWLRVA